MSNQEFEQAKAKLKPLARKVHDAANAIAADGKAVNKYWIEDNDGEATKKWEKCTIKFRVKDGHSYSEWVVIKLDDGTVLLDTSYSIGGSGNTQFDVNTFRNGAWVDRFITYSIDGVQAELEKQNKAELQEKLKPFSDIDF